MPQEPLVGPYAGLAMRGWRGMLGKDQEGDSASEVSLVRDLRTKQDAILQAKQEYVNWHSRRIQNHRRDEAYFDLEYFVPSPDQNRDPLKSPTAYQLVQELISHVIAEYPVISILPRSQHDASQQQSERLTRWANGFWRKTHLLRLLRDVLWDDAVRGVHVLRARYDPKAWPLEPVPPDPPMEPDDLVNAAPHLFDDYLDDLVDYEQAKDRYDTRRETYRQKTLRNLPIKVERIDPQYVFWEPGETPTRCIVCWDRPVDEVLARYPKTRSFLGDIPAGTKVTWNEYWSEEDFAYWVEIGGGTRAGGTSYGGNTWVVEPRAHHYGFFPFVIDGPWRTPRVEAERRFPSIYFGIRPFLQYESTLITSQAHILRRTGWPTLIVKSDAAMSQNRRPTIDVGPGVQNWITPEDDIYYLEQSGQTMAVLNEVVQNLSSSIDKATGMADILRGAPKGRSGYQQSQVAQMAKVALVPIEQCIGDSLSRITDMVLDLVDFVDKDITVIGPPGLHRTEVSIGPEDVRTRGEVSVRLKPKLPIDESQMIANYHNQQTWGWIPGVEAARLAGIESPEEMHAAWRAEQMEQTPFIRDAETLLWAKEHRPELYAIAQEWQLLQQQQQQAKSGQNDQAAKPEVPRQPGAPGSDPEAQQRKSKGTGMARNRAEGGDSPNVG